MRKTLIIFFLVIIGLVIWIIALNAKVSKVNKALEALSSEDLSTLKELFSEEDTIHSDQGIIINYLVKSFHAYQKYNKYMSRMTADTNNKTSPITDSLASIYHTQYISSRRVPTVKTPSTLSAGNPLRLDSTLSVLFDFPKILASMNTAYNPSSWTDTLLWQDRGFYVYLINYGNQGSDSTGSNRHRTSTVVQLAEKVNGEWTPKAGLSFDYGDLKPPKNPTIVQQ